MNRLDDQKYYTPADEAMRVAGTPGSLAQMRFKGVGPAYVKLGRRVLYKGSDVNRWLDEHRIEPAAA